MPAGKIEAFGDSFLTIRHHNDNMQEIKMKLLKMGAEPELITIDGRHDKASSISVTFVIPYPEIKKA